MMAATTTPKAVRGTASVGAGGGRRRRLVEPRSRQINVRVSDAEWAAIADAAEACGLSRGAWLAATAQASIDGHRDPLASVGLRDALAELGPLRADLAKIGTNLNQMARRANEGTPPGSKVLQVMRDQLDFALVTVGTVAAELGSAARRKR